MGPHGRPSATKAKNFGLAIKKLAIYSKKQMPTIATAIILTIISTILTLIGPSKLKDLTNIIADGVKSNTLIDMSAVKNIALLLVAFYSISAIFGYLQGLLMNFSTQRLSKGLRREISQKINKLPLKYLDSTPYGDVLSRITNDVDSMTSALNSSITLLISSVMTFVGSILMMFITNWILAISAILATSISIFLVFLIVSKSNKYFIQQQITLGALNGHIEEVYSGHNVIKAYNAEREMTEVFNKHNQQLTTCAWKSQFLSSLMGPLMHFISNFGYVVVCVVGSALAINGVINFGVIIAFMLYIKLFTQPLSQFAQCLTNIQTIAASSERVFEILDEPEMADESHKTKKLTRVKGDIEFKNVKFGYVDGKTIIKNFSANIKAGQKVAIVGPTGAGKTTIVNLLMRFYDIDSGDILIDGISINDLTRENVHDLFSMVLQDTWLFEGTVKENIVYSKENVSMQKVINACKECGLHHFIKTLPNGYDTKLTDATTISAGQKQLLTIARAMVQDSPMLILDEATSSVDTRTEVIIQKAMDKLLSGRTSFIIAHRLSTIKNADLILVMKDGDVIECGTHHELLASDGFYASLYNSQFENI